ncbi:MAG: hypothetical protein J6T74_05165, partial [Clostridia bacterium]|nr:hypothetical protein [Clostridia bacterium]
PEYPQEVKTVTGRQDIEVGNINTQSIRLGLYQIADGEYASATSGNRYATFNDLIAVQPNTTYTVTTSNNINAQFYELEYGENKSYLSNSSSSQNTKSYTFTTGSTTYYLAIDIRAYDMTNITTDYVGNILLSKIYEINLGKNLNSEGIRTGLYAIANGNYSSSSTYVTTNDLLPIPYGNTITVSSQYERTSGNSSAFYMLEYDENKTYLNQSTGPIWDLKSATFTIQNPNTKYIAVDIGSNATLDNIGGIQVEIGSQATSYSPYKTPIELCKIGTYKDYIKKSSGKNLFDNEFRQGSEGQTVNNYCFSKNDLVLSSGTYTLSNNLPSGFDYAIFGTLNAFPTLETKIYNSGWRTGTTTFTISQDLHIGILVRKGGNNFTPSDISQYSFMLNKGTTALPYEPYGHNWYICKNIRKVVLNGTEDWTTGSSATSRSVFSIHPFYDKVSGQDNFFSDKFKYRGNAQGTDLGYAMSFNTTTYKHFLYIQVPLDVVTSQNVSDFKTWLSNNVTTIYYPSETPTYTEIEDSELIKGLNTIQLLEGYNDVSITSEDLTA